MHPWGIEKYLVGRENSLLILRFLISIYLQKIILCLPLEWPHSIEISIVEMLTITSVLIPSHVTKYLIWI
jgi:hypothetical protein